MTNLVRGWGRVGVRGRVRVRVRFRGRSRGWVRVVDEPVATARRLITSGARGRVAVVRARAWLGLGLGLGLGLAEVGLG